MRPAFFLIRSRSLRVGYVFLIVIAGFVLIEHTQLLDSLNVGRLELVTDTDVYNRHAAHRTYYSNFFPYHYMTGDRHEYVLRYSSTPHNILIETLLLGGVIGLAIFLVFITSLIVSFIRDIKAGREECILFAAPILSVLLISLEHSSGFHTGLTICASLMALYEVARARSGKNNSNSLQDAV